MATRVLLTFDVELRWRYQAAGAPWQENFARSVEPAGVGLSWQLEKLAAHDLAACFFVDPMPAEVFGHEPVRRMIEPVLAAGQEVQLHLHPCWHSVAQGMALHDRFELTGFSAVEQRYLVAAARNLLMACGAPEPIAFRAGSFGADLATLSAVRAAGMHFDSSHNGSCHPWPSALPLPPGQIAPAALEGLIEIPVTQIADSRHPLRPFQFCAVSTEEIETALLHAEAEGHPLVTIVGHSFEFASRDGLRANGTLCQRFERLCAFLQRHSDRFPTVHFSDLYDVPLEVPARPLPASWSRTAWRMAEQLWSNTVYERAL